MTDLSASRWSTILSYCRSCDLSSDLYSFYLSACRSDALREFDCFFERDIVRSCANSVCTEILVPFGPSLACTPLSAFSLLAPLKEDT